MISSLESKVCFFFFCSVLFFTRRIPITVTTAKQLTYLCHFLHFHFSPSKQNEHSVFKKMAYFTDDRLHKSWRIFIRISAYLLYFLKNCLFWLCWVFICAQGFLFFFFLFFYYYYFYLFSLVVESGGFSCCGAQTLGHIGFSSCSSRILDLERRLGNYGAWP